MAKTAIIVLAIAMLVVAGGALASANFVYRNAEDSAPEIAEPAYEQAACTACDCNGRCGGSCNMPACGCK